MSLLTQTRESTGESKTRSRLTLKVPDGARVLIVCEDDSDTEQLKTILQKAGLRLRNPVGFRWLSRHPC